MRASVLVKRRVKRVLRRMVGGDARTLPDPSSERLVRRPAFILCTLRSGSTLLRVILDSHSQIHAPHEMHLRYISVHLDREWSERSVKAMRLDARLLEHLLWDRLLDLQLTRSGKPHIVEKTPNNVFIADRLRECWPDCRFIFLLRDPAAILRSRRRVKSSDYGETANVELIRRYCDGLESARQAHGGHTIRYEELTTDPARVIRNVCAFLGVSYEPEMLDYGQFPHGPYKSGLGDWKEKIKSGALQPAEPGPDVVPPALHHICVAWGYPIR